MAKPSDLLEFMGLYHIANLKIIIFNCYNLLSEIPMNNDYAKN